MVPIHHDPWFTFRFGDDRLTFRFQRYTDEEGELHHTTKDGRDITVACRWMAYTDQPPGYVVEVNTDITDRRRLQEGLERANRNKDEFLAMLGHELRNPLAPMLTAVHVLQRDKGCDQVLQRQATSMIERRVRHMTRLVDDLLEVARITKGKIDLKRDTIELCPAVLRAVETARPLVEARNHRLSVSLSDEPLWVRADPVRIEQVVTNLLNNAAKYTERGGQIWLTVSREGAEAVVRVRDTGIGIDAETLPHVFELYRQAEGAASHSEGGLGVGLSLVKGLVELHGGSVAASSAGAGRGSEFTVRLPVLASGLPKPGAASGSQGGAETTPLKVLVVDDNNDAADSLRMLL